MIQTFRQSARGLARRPGFTLLALFVMALCIGGNAATFSAVKAVLFQRLPYQNVDRLVILNLVALPAAAANDLSWAEAAEWRRRSTLLQDVSPFVAWRYRIMGTGGTVERIGVNYCPSSYLRLLGVRPELGRLFAAGEDGAPGSAPVILLGHQLWQRQFARDPRIVGKKILLNDLPYTVIGVMPRGFVDFMQGYWPIDAWLPAAQAGESFASGNKLFELRDERSWFVLARLRPGAALEQARQETAAIAAQLQREHPDTNRGYGASLTPLREFMFVHLFPGMKVLLVGAAFVLLIGCANVANLLLVRQAERQPELSLRLALGASPLQLAGHVLIESLVLALAGGALGLLLAAFGTKLLASLVELPAYASIRLDGGVLAFTVGATLLTGLLFGLPPAIQVARLDARGTLQQVRARAGGRSHSSRSRGGFLVVQVAFVVVLLVVAGLLLRSFVQLHATGVDFRTDRLLTLRLSFENLDTLPQVSQVEREMLRQIAGIAGTEGAALWGTGIPGISSQYVELWREGAAESDPRTRAEVHFVSDGAIRLLAVPLLRGRGFTPQDTLARPGVVMVTRSLGQALWPGQDPIGKRLRRVHQDVDHPWTVVGVVRDSRFEGPVASSKTQILFPVEQLPSTDATLLVRTSRAAGPMAAALRALVRRIDPRVPVYDVATLEQRLWQEEAGQRLTALVTSSFALIALLLAVAGLYGTLAYAVIQKTKEIGVRIALGAGRPAVVRMVMRRALALVALGLALGLGGALALARLLSALLFGVSARDPVTYAAASLLLLAVAAFAAYLPSRRAAKVEPVVALRFD